MDVMPQRHAARNPFAEVLHQLSPSSNKLRFGLEETLEEEGEPAGAPAEEASTRWVLSKVTKELEGQLMAALGLRLTEEETQVGGRGGMCAYVCMSMCAREREAPGPAFIHPSS